MDKNEHDELIAQLCDAMGEDIDTPVCREVAKHLANCEKCREQLASVKRTVNLCREHEHREKIPAEVTSRLLKLLKLPASK